MKYQSRDVKAVGRKYLEILLAGGPESVSPTSLDLPAKGNSFNGYERMRTNLGRVTNKAEHLYVGEFPVVEPPAVEPARIQLGTKVYELEFNGQVFRLKHGASGRVVKEQGEPLQSDLTYKISNRPYNWKFDERFDWRG
ncbi:MAG: hypothetical protein HY512_03165 [Candidatus Aenigmarchaeota archaeon]|nr:hypothetical protein [Candidatus Aenigmarchaeota archaeon]